jgi:hypothetical protein
MKIQRTILLSALALFFIAFTSSCKKDSESKSDLTSGIVGHYTNTSDNTDITVNKIDATHVSIALSSGTGSGHYTMSFTSVTMNSATAFTLNATSDNNYYYDETWTGTGTYSGNNISLFMSIHAVPTAAGLAVGDTEYTDPQTVSASK